MSGWTAYFWVITSILQGPPHEICGLKKKKKEHSQVEEEGAMDGSSVTCRPGMEDINRGQGNYWCSVELQLGAAVFHDLCE